MPVYEFRCDACEHAYSEFLALTAERPKKCPACGDKKSFGQVFSVPNTIVRGQPKTIGQAAEENAKRVGKEQMEMMFDPELPQNKKPAGKGRLPKGAKRVDTSKAETPWWRDGTVPGVPKLDKPLDVKKIKNVQKYIRTGEAS